MHYMYGGFPCAAKLSISATAIDMIGLPERGYKVRLSSEGVSQAKASCVYAYLCIL